jgi:DNA-binding Lrp family transcriptional regulator
MSVSRVYCVICDLGRATIVEIARRTGLPPWRVANAVSVLKSQGSIRMVGYRTNPAYGKGIAQRWVQIWEAVD